MTQRELKIFLWNCTKLNFYILLLVFLVVLLSDHVYSIHKYFYGGSMIEFKKDLYLIMGFYKIIWFFFNVIPYWVIRQMDKKEL